MANQIRLKRLTLLNFKGIRQFDAEFSDNTVISGDNATGKTTLFDAFTWLLFGKNSGDQKDFNIKTLDAQNNPIPQIDHEVRGVLLVDGEELVLRRVYREKWEKKRGTAVAVMTGHETDFFYNDVPMQQAEYKKKIDDIINEKLFKLLTNALYFNSMSWQDRRVVLFQIAGTLTDADVAGENEEYLALIGQLKGKTLEEFKREIAAKKEKLQDELDDIPGRIDEVNRAMPELVDEEETYKEIEAKQLELKGVDANIENANEAHREATAKATDIRNKRFKLEGDLQQLRSKREAGDRNRGSEQRVALTNAQATLKQLQQGLEHNRTSKANKEQRIATLTKENDDVREKWRAVQAETLTIDPASECCPACKQALPEEQLHNFRENAQANFNDSKLRRATDLQKQGNTNKVEIEKLQGEVEMLTNDIASQEQLIAQQQTTISDIETKLGNVDTTPTPPTAEETALQGEIDALVVPDVPTVDTSALRAQKTALQGEIDKLRATLTGQEQITRLNARVTELEDLQKTYSQQKADLEGLEFTIANFNKAKIETIEQRVNSLFGYVTFKMFEQQINGGETECCDCLVKGVPYNDVNTAGKINAGLDVLNALMKHHGVSAPVWIDNRESINQLIDCDTQLVSLVVSNEKKLKVA